MNSNLQNKLQQFSAAPPDGVWDKIADALDEGSFSQRLYQYEERPPAAAWQEVEKSLETAVPPNVVPFTTRFRRPLRYAAAACLLAVILVTITLTVRRTEAGAIEAGSNTTVPAGNTAATNNRSATQPVNAPGSTASTSQQQNAANPSKEIREDSNPVAANSKGKNQREGAKASFASLNEYVFFRDGDGKMRKVSKKMASFVNCKDGDSNCQQRLQELRRKLAANATTTDFTGILDMLRQLQQKP